MIRKHHILAVVGVLTILVAVPASAAKLNIFVSIVPQKTFVERIGGDHVAVSVMVQPGASPAIYEPKPTQMAALAKARLYFSIGVPFELAWLDRIRGANREMSVIAMHRGIKRMPMAAPDDLHRESPGGLPVAISDTRAHDHGGGIEDPHVWLSPPHVRLMAVTLLDALSAADPDHAATYAARCADFVREINETDVKIFALLATDPGRGRDFLVFHPSWGYFARVYGLRQVPIESEGREPGPKELARLISYAKRIGIRTIFVQPEFSRKSAKTIAESLGATVVPISPLDPDWSENLLRAATAIRKALP